VSYSPATHPKLYRGGKVTAAAYLRESRYLSWR
jgi:hypothetical protein